MFSLVQYTPFSVAGYEYPTWALVLGWFIAILSIVCIPAGAVHAIATAEGKSLWQVRLSFRLVYSYSVYCVYTSRSGTCYCYS